MASIEKPLYLFYLKEFSNSTVYFILSSDINAYQKQIKEISITSEVIWYLFVIDISLYFHCSVLWITSDFPFT